MIVRKLTDLAGTDREVRAENWQSRRLLLRNDKMGFSLHDTIIFAGTSTEMHYQNHLEAVYCIKGKGTVTIVGTGEVFDAGFVVDRNQCAFDVDVAHGAYHSQRAEEGTTT